VTADVEDVVPVEVAAEVVTRDAVAAEPVEEPPIVDAETIEQPSEVGADATPARKGARRRKAAAPRAKTAKGVKGEKGGTSEKGARVGKPRARKTARTKSEAADQH
jgi:hypothetical protein